jgi:hypothetical protein
MRCAVEGLCDPVEVRHKPRQIVEATPEAVDLCDRDLQLDRFSNMHAALAAEGRLRAVGLMIAIQDVRPPAGDAAVQQWCG